MFFNKEDQIIKCFYKIPDMNFLFRNKFSDSKLGTCYEAPGIPLCLLNQKRFQTEYSKALKAKIYVTLLEI